MGDGSIRELAGFVCHRECLRELALWCQQFYQYSMEEKVATYCYAGDWRSKVKLLLSRLLACMTVVGRAFLHVKDRPCPIPRFPESMGHIFVFMLAVCLFVCFFCLFVCLKEWSRP